MSANRQEGAAVPVGTVWSEDVVRCTQTDPNVCATSTAQSMGISDRQVQRYLKKNSEAGRVE